ncbi:hypothetical protein DPMN_179775 [Dreissena polymorpha]|uniref:Uncharacterized protein n=1 Tax=Dreissena polymorpha TaxID=45954 RepID=A0A9D4EHR1_DREPO|nr:hypothetical protein DPMN_179775 [Dreissena polymorpha]
MQVVNKYMYLGILLDEHLDFGATAKCVAHSAGRALDGRPNEREVKGAWEPGAISQRGDERSIFASPELYRMKRLAIPKREGERSILESIELYRSLEKGRERNILDSPEISRRGVMGYPELSRRGDREGDGSIVEGRDISQMGGKRRIVDCPELSRRGKMVVALPLNYVTMRVERSIVESPELSRRGKSHELSRKGRPRAISQNGSRAISQRGGERSIKGAPPELTRREELEKSIVDSPEISRREKRGDERIIFENPKLSRRGKSPELSRTWEGKRAYWRLSRRGDHRAISHRGGEMSIWESPEISRRGKLKRAYWRASSYVAEGRDRSILERPEQCRKGESHELSRRGKLSRKPRAISQKGDERNILERSELSR